PDSLSLIAQARLRFSEYSRYNSRYLWLFCKIRRFARFPAAFSKQERLREQTARWTVRRHFSVVTSTSLHRTRDHRRPRWGTANVLGWRLGRFSAMELPVSSRRTCMGW